MKRSSLIAAAVIGAVALGGAAMLMIDGEQNVDTAIAQSAVNTEMFSDETIATLRERGYAIGEIPIGDPDAPVTIIEYARLDCPACRAFHEDTLPVLKERYIDTGVARLVVREVYANQPGLVATVVARCGGADRYHGLLDAIFRQQDVWGRSRSMEELQASLATIARLGGLTVDQLQTCFSDQLLSEHLVAVGARDADADNVQRTPTLMINGEMFTGRYNDIDALGAMIEEAAAQ